MRFSHFLHKIFRIAAIKILLQVLQLANVLLILNVLSKSDYGIYAPIIVLATIAGTIGCRGLDNAVVSISKNSSFGAEESRLLTASAVRLSYKLLLFVIPCSVGFFVYFYAWEIGTLKTIVGIALLLCTPFMIAFRKILDGTLVSEDRARTVMLLQVLSESFRGIILIIVFFTDGGLLYVLVAFIVGALFNAFAALKYVGDVPFESTFPQHMISLKAQTCPLLPGIVFANFQGNIIIILALFVAGIDTVASVAVASRFAFFFVFLDSIASYTLLPIFSAPVLLSVYVRKLIQAVLAFGCSALIIAVVIYIFFDLVLVMIGEEYRIIQTVLPAVLATHVLTVLASLLWVAQVGRKWVWAWMPYVSIPSTLAVQAIMLLLLDISTLEGAILFGLGSAVIAIGIRLIMIFYGIMIHEHRGTAANSG